MSNLKAFENNGGRFLVSESLLTSKLNHIKAFVFDWDGVFTNGEKDHELQSRFNEVDSMGTNMLRFSFFLEHKELPVTAIISGENNKTAFTFATRECFNANYFKIANKTDATKHLCETYGIVPNEIAYVFDDVLDLSIAKECGLRIFISRKSNPLFNEYVVKNKLADYITYSESGNFAVRESCELLMGVYNLHDEAITQRVNYSENYAGYIELRRAVKTKYHTIAEGKIVDITP
ncbi:MAG TPA: phosphatase [Bacteroidia bacterium]|jgi:3-deoxy-D-manno-octulosonate 8-phosphate phosphatase (KDO 8-P phosphatase)|nr:phosphatase [Bacteroidia bacterium]